MRLWVRSQVDHIEHLDLTLQGTDRQVLGGQIPGVSLTAANAVYRGIHLDSAAVSARDILINLGQVVRGKPLRLLQSFSVYGEVMLSQDSLNASLSAPYLAEGVENFWQTLLSQPPVAAEIEQHYGPAALQPAPTSTSIQSGRLTLMAGARQLRAGLVLHEGHWLGLEQPCWVTPAGDFASQALQGFCWDLGPETQMETLSLQPGRLLCVGQLEVRP